MEGEHVCGREYTVAAQGEASPLRIAWSCALVRLPFGRDHSVRPLTPLTTHLTPSFLGMTTRVRLAQLSLEDSAAETTLSPARPGGVSPVSLAAAGTQDRGTVYCLQAWGAS